MKLVLRVIGILSIIISVIWFFVDPTFPTLLGILAGLAAFLGSFVSKEEKSTETLDQRNRRVMLDHVENFWVKGILEKSLHGAALLELGIKEDPSAVNYPWTIKKETTNEVLPAGKSMWEIFQEIGLGRSLLILGAPGSGKTTMMLELTRKLIENARQDDTEPIPVVFNLASWKENQTLADWLAQQLKIVYYVPKNIAASWAKGNKMLLLLDGLDEVEGDRRAKCVEAINQFRNEYGFTSLAVCSRIEEYSALKTKLSLEAAITLQPLTDKQINAYIDRFGNSLASVKLLLKQDKTLPELTETPLMLSIIALAYKDRDADELIVTGNLEEQRKHIFNTYITHMFKRSTRTANTFFLKEETLQYLHWLARMMRKHDIATYQIESMQPSWLYGKSQHLLYQTLLGLFFGLLFAPLFWARLGQQFVPLLGVVLIFGLFFWILYYSRPILDFGDIKIMNISFYKLIDSLTYKITMVDKLKWSGREAGTLLIGTSLGDVPMIPILYGSLVGVLLGWIDGPLVGLLGGLTVGLITGLRAEQIQESTHPGQRLRQTILNVAFVVTLIWPLFGLFSWFSNGPKTGLMGGLYGALFLGVIYGGLALIQHYLLRIVLMLNKSLPRRLIPFLNYAVDLIFLRRVGGSYIFVHRLLMEHFAKMDA